MTPGPAAAADVGGDDASPFAGTDLCAEARRRLRAGGRRPVFDDDVWCFGDVDGLAVQLSEGDVRMDFTAVCDPRWRLLAKEYLLARMVPGHELVAVLPHAYRIPLALRSCKRRLAELAELAGWLNWLTADGVGSLPQVSQQHCDRYLHHRRARRDRDGAVLGSVEESVVRLAAAVIIELALYRELFTAGAYAPGFRPWDGRSPTRVAGMRTPEGNKTRSSARRSRSRRSPRLSTCQAPSGPASWRSASGSAGSAPPPAATGPAPETSPRSPAATIATDSRWRPPRPTSSRPGSPAAGIRTTRCSE